MDLPPHKGLPPRLYAVGAFAFPLSSPGLVGAFLGWAILKITAVGSEAGG